MKEKILFVDDEPNVLEAYQRSLRKEFEIETATGGADGLIALASQGPYAVIITDMRMPGMDGVEFLARAKEKSPDSIRIMLTGNADQQTAIDAINEGAIFRFLTKPCPPTVLAHAIRAGLRQYQLVTAEKELLNKTLSGSIHILTDLLSLVNPTAFGRASRVRRLVKQITTILKVENAWQVEIAAMLSQVGCITIPEETLWRVYSGHSLNSEEVKMVQAHPQIGHDLIQHIPRLEGVAEIIAYQEKLFNGGGVPYDNRRGYEIPLGARILKLALDYDKLAESRLDSYQALEEIRERHNWYDPEIIPALELALKNEVRYELKLVRIDELTPDMLLAEDIKSVKGMLLLTKGQEVTRSLCMRLKNFRDGGAIVEPLQVLVPVKSNTGKLAPSGQGNKSGGSGKLTSPGHSNTSGGSGKLPTPPQLGKQTSSGRLITPAQAAKPGV